MVNLIRIGLEGNQDAQNMLKMQWAIVVIEQQKKQRSSNEPGKELIAIVNVTIDYHSTSKIEIGRI